MALASAQALLDELMGRDRNLAPTDKKRDLDWKAEEVCKHHLVKFCPNELFVNTKADLGPCTKIHDDSLRKEYERSNRFQQMGYEEEFLRYCQNMLADVDKRIRRAKQRLALGHQEGGIPTPGVVRSSEEKVKVLTDKINDLLTQVEQLGCEGKVEEAQGIMRLCDKLKEERENLRKSSESNHWLQQTAEIAAAQEKQMEVCDVCGAFLIVGDAQQRVDDHLSGKQHVGYAKVKNAVEEILNQRDKVREEGSKRKKDLDDQKRQKDDDDKHRERRSKKMDEERKWEQDRERSRRRSRSQERRRSRSHSRSCRQRNKSRERERSHNSHSSWHRGKEREKTKGRSRSRDRTQSRDHTRDSHHSRESRKNRNHESDYRRSSSSKHGQKRSGHSERNEERKLYSSREESPSENGELSFEREKQPIARPTSDNEGGGGSSSVESTDD